MIEGEDVLEQFPSAFLVFMDNLLHSAHLFGTQKQQGYIKAVKAGLLYTVKCR